MTSRSLEQKHNRARMAVIVAALGYFVDVYDIILFTIVRVPSLKSLGVTGDKLLSDGVFLLNAQMAGMLLGGILWGIYGDKKGRIAVLFGSILLYSVANIANAFVNSVGMYAVLRFLAGLGLAGEIGAGITLVSELMPKETRGYATTIIATVGVSGAVAASLIGDLFDWRTAYIIGGVSGLLLLVLRVSVSESGLFDAIRSKDNVPRGDLKLLFCSRERALRYIYCILVGVPIWFVTGILATFSPEVGAELGVPGPIKAGNTMLCLSVGITVGDLVSGILSQLIRSRKKAMFIFIAVTLLLCVILVNVHWESLRSFYGMYLALGFFIGYWAVFVTTAAEQFGTNLRATVATTVPNFVRGSTVIMTLAFSALKPSFGILASAQIVGFICFAFAGLAVYRMKETYAVDLDFLEKD